MMSPAVSHVHWWEIPHTLSGTYSECRQFYLPASTPHLSSANTRSAGFSRLLHGKFTNSNRYYSTRRKNGVLVRPYPILTRTSARAIYFLFFFFYMQNFPRDRTHVPRHVLRQVAETQDQITKCETCRTQTPEH